MAYVSAAITGIADIDAITLSTAKWAAAHPEQSTVAQRLILAAIFSNSVFKLTVSLIRGVPSLRKAALRGFGLVISAGVLYLVLIAL
jgi:uncharacterized membrane protein (DUF4010 family)